MPWVNSREPRGLEVTRRQLESALGQLQGAKGAGGHQEADRECPGTIAEGQGVNRGQIVSNIGN